MNTPPSGRCGYTWPEDHHVEADPNHQSCCYRETHQESDRCVWHATDLNDKSITELQESRATNDVRLQNTLFNELLDGAHLPGCTFTDDVSFKNTALRGANLKEADLSGGDCYNAVLDEANLTGANLREAHFSGRFIPYTKDGEDEMGFDPSHQSDSYPSMSGANLSKVDLSNAYLPYTDLSGATLTNATLDGAHLNGADFTETTLLCAELPETALDGSTFTDAICGETDMSASSIKNADFSEAELCEYGQDGVDFSGSNLAETCFLDTHIGQSSFAGADITEVSFGSEGLPLNLEETDFSGATIQDVDLSDVYFGGAKLADAELEDVDLSGVFMNHADFSGATLTKVDLSGTWLYKADFTDAELFHIALTRGEADVDDLSNLKINTTHLSADPDENSTESHIISPTMSESILAIGEPEAFEPTLVEADFANATLHDVDFSDRRLSEVVLEGAECSAVELSSVALDKAALSKADLSTLDFTDLTLTHADLTAADLTGTNFTRADCTAATFDTAICQEAVFDNAILEDASIVDADFRKASLIGANCEGTDFSETNLNRASLDGADLVGANLTKAYLFGTTFDGARISSQTKLNDGEIGAGEVNDYCRYDTRAEPSDAGDSVGIDDNEIQNQAESSKAIQLRRGRSVYRRLEQLATQNGFPELQSDLFIRRQELGRKLQAELGPRRNRILPELSRLTMLYGESFKRIAGVSAIVIVVAWLMTVTAGVLETSGGTRVDWGTVSEQPLLLGATFLHSIDVFFTGGGLFEPVNGLGELLITFESAMGPVLLALLVFVLGRRAAR